MQPNTRAHHAHAIRRSAALLSAVLAVCLALVFPASSRAADEAQPKAGAAKTSKQASKKDKVVFHVTTDDPKFWNQSLNNMNQLQKVLGKDNVDIELVVNGFGIGMLRMESAVGNRVNDAVANGIKVVACEETMRGQKLTKDDMLGSIGYVPGGVIEVIQRQKEGYAYLKP
jgi:hypothetical protein